MVVTLDSGRAGVHDNEFDRVSGADHSSICKPQRSNSKSYLKLLEVLEKVAYRVSTFFLMVLI